MSNNTIMWCTCGHSRDEKYYIDPNCPLHKHMVPKLEPDALSDAGHGSWFVHTKDCGCAYCTPSQPSPLEERLGLNKFDSLSPSEQRKTLLEAAAALATRDKLLAEAADMLNAGHNTDEWELGSRITEYQRLRLIAYRVWR